MRAYQDNKGRNKKEALSGHIIFYVCLAEQILRYDNRAPVPPGSASPSLKPFQYKNVPTLIAVSKNTWILESHQ